ncbi:hypothetical protein RRG08_017319 [Elysia crispata]|uniref:Uncharacterized protein n=1 Tax=Elysia crispata TaxID=231223 RepID=A0AAE1DMT5_9GAST|nr:hypothetical protein RRG08_017319 [Elysia crispata]
MLQHLPGGVDLETDLVSTSGPRRLQDDVFSQVPNGTKTNSRACLGLLVQLECSVFSIKRFCCGPPLIEPTVQAHADARTYASRIKPHDWDRDTHLQLTPGHTPVESNPRRVRGQA